MMEEKIRIVVSSSSYESAWSYVDELPVLRSYICSKSKFFYFLMQLMYKISPKSQYLFYDKRNTNLEGTCILFDAGATLDFLKWFKLKNPHARLVFYYWNGVEPNKIQPNDIKDIGYEVWSFDPDNCKQYGLRYNREFFCYSWYKDINNNVPIKYDISFVGRDKNGRMQAVQDQCDMFPEELCCDLYFTANKWFQRFTNINYKPYLKYKKLIEKELEARALLDFSQIRQSSITLRVYDALVNNRKVITNNLSILSDSIYSPQNVYVIGYDKMERLLEFINTPFEPIQEDIMFEHSINGWVNRFFY